LSGDESGPCGRWLLCAGLGRRNGPNLPGWPRPGRRNQSGR